MRRLFLLLTVGTLLCLFSGLFKTVREGFSIPTQQIEAQTPGMEETPDQILPLGKKVSEHQVPASVCLAPQTYSCASTLLRVPHFSPTVRHSISSLPQLRRLIRYLQHQVAVYLTHHHVNHCIGRHFSRLVYTFAIRHIII